jgi:hypothetical protein
LNPRREEATGTARARVRDSRRATIASRRAIALAVLLLATTASSAQGSSSNAVLTPERTLSIEFITTPPFIESNPNVLTAMLGYVNIVEPYATITGSLYDGATLLGTATSTNGAGHTGIYSFHPVPVSWKTATSPYNPDAWLGPGNEPAIVDFTSLHDGTIVGRIDITIDAGRIEFDYADIGLSTMFATYSNGGSSIPPNPRITSIRLIPELPGDPEPPTLPADPPPPPTNLDDDDDYVVSTTELKAACEESAGNAVVLNHSVKVTNGSAQVNAGCTLILGEGATIEFDGANLTFDGPLSAQSSQRASVKLNRSLFIAPTININLSAKGSSVGLKDSTLRAAGGDLLAALGEEGTLELVGRFSGAAEALSAGGTVQLRGGRKFSAMVLNANVGAGANVQVDLSGAEGVFKVEGSSLSSAAGNVIIAGASTNTLVEMKQAGVFFGRTATIRTSGADGIIKLNLMDFGPSAGTSTAGAVTFEAGSGRNPRGAIEVSEIDIRNVGAFTAYASRGGSKGLLKFEKSNVTATGLIVFETGSEGTTEEKDNTLTSGTRIRVVSGGSCSSSSSHNAPSIEACQ